jgi:hypothetical protein
MQQQIAALKERINGKKQTAGSPMNGSPLNGTSAAPHSNGTAKKKKEPGIHYYPDTGKFWRLSPRGEWVQFTEASIRRFLKHGEFREVEGKEAKNDAIERRFIELQENHDVAYAGPLAGYKAGLHEICGERILVTRSPRLMVPTPGKWDALRHFFESLLGADHGASASAGAKIDQVPMFYSWIKASLKSLYAGPPFRPAPMLAIAGPPNCGKSLLQNLITEMFGGRPAKPYRYLTGQTAFNSDLFAAEHLMIEDDATSINMSERLRFGQAIKNMLFGEVQSFHRKGREAMSSHPFWRVTISLNEEPENLMVLPPLDKHVTDKILLLLAKQVTFPYPDDNIEARNAYRRQLSSEIPHFIHFLRSYRIPDRLHSQRCGVAAWQNPELVEAINELAPETSLLKLIDKLRPWNGIDAPPPAWEGFSNDLEQILQEKDAYKVKQLLTWHGACGAYLKRLAKHRPDRVRLVRQVHKTNLYSIAPPENPFTPESESEEGGPEA